VNFYNREYPVHFSPWNYQEVFYATRNSETFVNTTTVVGNLISRTEEEGGWTIGAANGTSRLGMNNMLIEGNINVQVSGIAY
jgi:hypothetical protein